MVLALAFAMALQAPVERDWSEALRRDAAAMHRAIAENHPGPVNPTDPAFAARNDAELGRALERAKQARTFADYFYALQEYLAAFNDGHMSFGVYGNTPDLETRWPGFLTRYDSSGEQIVFISQPWSGVKTGSRLLSCDGLAADEVSRRRVGSRWGRWMLASQRRLFGAMSFLDTGNPYVPSIRQCRFSIAGREYGVPLQWRASNGSPYERFNIFPRVPKRATEARFLTNGTAWISLPSFDGNPDSATGKALRQLIAELDKNGEPYRSAPAIVLDLRQNGGGSADWSYQIADRLWGRAAIDNLDPKPMTIRWRASKGNLASIEDVFAERSRSGNLSPAVTQWFLKTIAGLRTAIERGESSWVIQPSPARQKPAVTRPIHRLTGPVYVLTDASCMSACLDAVDLWTALGAIPIGQETSADTLYLEVRQVPLPTGLGAFSLPMKVYSGRPRGSNEPVVPRHRFDGDINATKALEVWVAGLPRARR